ncbi:MAG TPA: L-seryl-tRNA(Sec) selenium transferase [Terriglobales bacterium]|nr:L-seryl-tRNA(Sec) selenium transferase [Terriglobales bacterium]
MPVRIDSNADLYRKLPSVDELLRRPELAAFASREGQGAVTDAARAVLATLRQEIAARHLDANAVDLALSGLEDAVARQVRQALQYSLRTVINATGVILHTNLGRAPLPASALEFIREISGSYSNLEFDLETGERGKRDVHVDRLFRKLLDEQVGAGAPARVPEPGISTIVVNNNAAAILLALNTLADGGEVIVSRGELIEIGGSFRIPDVMSKSNAVLREVGTTNRTRIGDYAKAINEKTRLLLRVHRSNFQITGFTEQPQIEELVDLARKRNLPLVEDLGSGALFDLRSIGVNGEPSVLDSLRQGVDVITYSGDKLLGGPQAGMLSGRADLIARMRSNSLFRALRVDKLTYAVLEATLLAYVKGEHDAIPALRMMRLSKDEIGQRVATVAERIKASGLSLEVLDGESVIGGGAAPSAVLPTRLLAITCEGSSADELSSSLRVADPPIIARVEEGRVLLDLRTVFPEQDEAIVKTLKLIVENDRL